MHNQTNTAHFLTASQVRSLAEQFGTPAFVYDETSLIESAKALLSFPAPYGLTVRYAMKASPNASFLKLFQGLGLHMDASSGVEVERALQAGIQASEIQLTAQEIPDNLEALVKKGLLFNACSLHQLKVYGELFPHTSLSIRINPGLGSGHSNRTNVGGPSSSFGIWWEWIPEAKKILKSFDLTLKALHTHIGSGSLPSVWEKVAQMSLETVEAFPTVTTLNLGGGFKVARTPSETTTDLQVCGNKIASALKDFRKKTGRELRLELEPGSYLMALNGALLSKVIDKVNTGPKGYRFVKLNTGMTEIARPTLYGAQHDFFYVEAQKEHVFESTEKTILAGHCCESGDILTPSEGNPEELSPREMPKLQIGDYVVLLGAGAYCSSMSFKNYNSFPEAPEVLLQTDGTFRLIRKRQTLDQILQNEL